MAEEIIQLGIKEVVEETPDTKSFYLDIPSNLDYSYKPGQFLTVIPKIDGVAHRRAYSLCTSPYTDDTPGFTVKQVDGGMVSNYLHQSIKAGDKLDFLKPMGQFTSGVHANLKRHIVLFAGGSGITPLYSILKSILAKEPKSYVSLIYSNKNPEMTIYKDELDDLKAQYLGRFQLVYVYTQHPEYDGPKGRVNPDMIKELLGQVRPAEPLEKEEFYLCGPTAMMETVIASLKAEGIEEEQIKMESFTADLDILKPGGKDSSMDTEDKTRHITVIFEDEDFEVPVEPGQTILEAGEEVGIDLPFSCRGGVCTSCLAKTKQGKVKVSDSQEALLDGELEEGFILNCCSYPESDDVIIEVD